MRMRPLARYQRETLGIAVSGYRLYALCVVQTTASDHRRISKLEVLREHRPPPNASIIELWQFIPDLEWTPGSAE